jgi:hypothetical protein
MNPRRKYVKKRSSWEASMGISRNDPAGAWLRDNDPREGRRRRPSAAPTVRHGIKERPKRCSK